MSLVVCALMVVTHPPVGRAIQLLFVLERVKGPEMTLWVRAFAAQLQAEFRPQHPQSKPGNPHTAYYLS